ALSGPTPVAELAAAQIHVDVRRGDREPGRHAVEHREHGRAVRLAGGEEPHGIGRGRADRMASSGAGTPVQSSKERAAWCSSMLRPSTTVTFSAAFARLTSGVSVAGGMRSTIARGRRRPLIGSSLYIPIGVALTTRS